MAGADAVSIRLSGTYAVILKSTPPLTFALAVSPYTGTPLAAMAVESSLVGVYATLRVMLSVAVRTAPGSNLDASNDTDAVLAPGDWVTLTPES